MNGLLNGLMLCEAHQVGLLFLWLIVIVLLFWVIVELGMILVKNVIYYKKTKKDNKETFKKYNFKPKH